MCYLVLPGMEALDLGRSNPRLELFVATKSSAVCRSGRQRCWCWWSWIFSLKHLCIRFQLIFIVTRLGSNWQSDKRIVWISVCYLIRALFNNCCPYLLSFAAYLFYLSHIQLHHTGDYTSKKHPSPHPLVQK